jgi:hypothetical protein
MKTSRTKDFLPLAVSVIVLVALLGVEGFVGTTQKILPPTRRRQLLNNLPSKATTKNSCARHSSHLQAVKIDGYDEAFAIIDKCSVSGEPTEDLYDAVRFIDKNAMKIYPSLEEKEAFWRDCYGSWKLQMATGGGKFTTFKPVPIFAFAMVDETNFGNGVGVNEDWILLSLLGAHKFNAKRRQMIITIDDMYLFGKKATGSLPGFIKDGIGLGKQPEDWTSGRPPAFTFIGASDNSLIARGGSGGIAIWTRLEKDIRPAAYGS